MYSNISNSLSVSKDNVEDQAHCRQNDSYCHQGQHIPIYGDLQGVEHIDQGRDAGDLWPWKSKNVDIAFLSMHYTSP